MNPLCCIAPVAGPKSVGLPDTASFISPSPILQPISADSEISGSDSALAAACGILHKWVNYGRGWRSRWFVLDGDGVLSYYKIHGPEKITTGPGSSRIIGDLSVRYLRKSVLEGGGEGASGGRPFGEIHLKVSSVRVSRSDDKRLSIFTGTKTLHLRCESREDRTSWLECLNAVKGYLPRAMSTSDLDVAVSTDKVRARLTKEGVNETAIRDCEAIMKSEFSELQSQLKNMKLKHLSLLDTLRQLETEKLELEATVVDERKDADRRASDFYSVLSDASASDSEVDLETDEGDRNFDFLPPERCYSSRSANATCLMKCLKFPYVRRRTSLPEPKEKEKGVGLWSIIKDNIGKDLSGVCLPVYFNEPLSSLQKCFEDLEFSYLVDHALQWGKQGNDLMRILNVAAFAVSAYASTEGRQCKPFNPLLGETYEADYPDKGLRFISEKVSHHPMVVACHCEGRGWKFFGDSNLKGKFWGRSIQLDPVGVLTLRFEDGETFQWSKVTTSIYNIIIGKIYCDHYGTMRIEGSGRYSCKVKFKEQSIIDRNPHQVHGFVHDNVTGETVALLVGKWDEAIYYVLGDPTAKPRNYDPMTEAVLLWEKDKTVATTRYNLTPFAISLNEVTAGLGERLPASDSRLRPDQRYLENGEYERANQEKMRLEHLQRQARKMQEGGWKPRWFEREEEGCYRYKGGYWEAREAGNWAGVSDLFHRGVKT